MIVNRLTVSGRDYILPGPVDGLRAAILQAIRAGGGYITVPGLRGGSATELLVTRGTPISWSTIEVDDEPAPPAAEQLDTAALDLLTY
jgi:hypothetical protein